MKKLALLLSVTVLGITLYAQSEYQITLDDIFTKGTFRAESTVSLRSMKDGIHYTTMENDTKILKNSYETGEQVAVLFDITKIEDTAVSSFSNYKLSDDETKILLTTDIKPIYRRSFTANYYIWNSVTEEFSPLSENGAQQLATFSPDGNYVAFVRDNNLFIKNLKFGSESQITWDGEKNKVINGAPDWVYEEEFGFNKAFWWSPDSKFLAFIRFDETEVPEFSMTMYAGESPVMEQNKLYPGKETFKYPKAGTTNSACRAGIVNADGGPTVWLKVPGDPRNHYIARMEWAADSREVVLQHLNRLQNTLELMLGHAETGEVRAILTETDEAWVDVVNDLNWLDKGKKFTWMSERDGWNHLYLVSRDGKNIGLITAGDYDVISIAGLDKDHKWVYFIASPDNPTQRFLYRCRLDGEGTAERITPQEMEGSHSYQLSPDTDWAIHTYSSFGVPPVTDLVRLPSHETVRILENNRELHAKVKALQRMPVEFFRVDIDGVKLDAYCMKPADFNPDKSYPLLFHVYGEPAGSTVRDNWGGSNYLWHTMLNQHGYLVMSVDNRGTKVPRGRAWRKSIYRQIGILASKDQAAACRAIIKQRPYIDTDRIGIWGWSGGGSMSLNMIFRYPELYSTAIAIATVSNQRFYDTIYQERYMGIPEHNPEGFKQGSPVTHAHKLEGNLLLVHGSGDDNCHYQSAEALINELIRHNKMFSFMPYPNRSHGIHEGENTRRHLFETLTRFLTRNMPPDQIRNKTPSLPRF